MAEFSHGDGRRYWRFESCGECDDAECCEGEAIDVTDAVRGLMKRYESLLGRLTSCSDSEDVVNNILLEHAREFGLT